MPELTDLDVDRVDAVDSPATRRRFLITKADGDAPAAAAADPIADATRLLTAAQKALGGIRKSADAGLAIDAELGGALNELAAALDEQPVWKAAEPVAPVAAPAAVAAPAPAVDPTAAIATAVATEVAKSLAPLGEGITAILRTMQGSEPIEPTRTAPPPSAQPGGQAVAKAATRKLGEGMFAGVFHG